MMTRIADIKNIAGLNEPVDFIFDRQDEHETFMRDAWDFLKEFSTDGIRRRLGKRPHFEKDTEFMPLQAADLHAWWVRKRYEIQEKGEPPIAFMWKETRDLHSIPILINGDNLRDFFSAIVLALRTSIGITYGWQKFIQLRHLEFAVEQPSIWHPRIFPLFQKYLTRPNHSLSPVSVQSSSL